MEQAWLFALIGGLLIGLSSLFMLALLGRIAGISGILAGCLKPEADGLWRYLFVAGLICGPLVYRGLTGSDAPLPSEAGWLITVVAGLLVGFGTRLGGGCTSGHGVCGIGRLSVRSMAATATFMALGFITVYIARHLLGGV